MQKIRIDHRTKFPDKVENFMHDLFPVREILRSIFISGKLRVLIS